MRREAFEELVLAALDELPSEFREKLENVEVVVEDWPSRHDLARAGIGPSGTLLGLYTGIPRTARGVWYGNVLPDRITIYQGPIEACCRSREEIVQTVRDTVMHEIGHYFGLSDQRLREIEAARRERTRSAEPPPRRRYRRVGGTFDEPAEDTPPAPEEQ
jgi:predicted Zn-dependent protease with MMP-like domain